MILTKRRERLILEFVGKYDLLDYWTEEYDDKYIVFGISRDRKMYKKVVR